MSHLVCVLQFKAGDDLTLQLRVLTRFIQDGLAELGNVDSTSFSQDGVEPVVWKRQRRKMKAAADFSCCMFSTCFQVFTCILGDLSLGDHLLALGIHQLAVLVLLQALQDVPGVCFSAETLQEQFRTPLATTPTEARLKDATAAVTGQRVLSL